MHSLKNLVLTLVLIALASCGDGTGPQTSVNSQDQGAHRHALLTTDFSQASSAEQAAVRLYQAFYGKAAGNARFTSIVSSINANGAAATAFSIAADSSIAGLSDAALATLVLDNLNVTAGTVSTPGSYKTLLTALEQMFSGYGKQARGQIILNAATLLGNLQSDATWGVAATAYLAQTSANYSYSSTKENSSDAAVASSTTTLNCSGTSLTGGQQYCASSTGKLSNGVGYTVWLSNATTGTNCGTYFGVDAAFKADWNMNAGGDFLARAGLQWDKTKTHDQIGTITADYAYQKSGVANTKAYIGVYGWSTSPLVEFYIIEEWIGWNPASNATKVGSFTVDDGTYDIYTHTNTNKDSIEGIATYPQYFSIRTSARQCGHISVSEHFNKWASLNMPLGKMYDTKLLVEAMGGTGTVEFTSAKVTVK